MAHYDKSGPSQGLKIRVACSTGWGECAPLVEIGLTVEDPPLATALQIFQISLQTSSISVL